MSDTAQTPDLMTLDELARFLRLDSDRPGKPANKVRSLVRRHALPVIRRGRLQLYSRSAILEWLNPDRTAAKTM